MSYELGTFIRLHCDSSAKYEERPWKLKHYRQHWNLLGHFDVLSASRIARSDADDFTFKGSRKASTQRDPDELHGARISMMLFPASVMLKGDGGEVVESDRRVFDRLANPQMNRETPLLYVASLTLSPLAHELTEDLEAVFNLISKIGHDTCRGINVDLNFYCSLSDPDCVFIAFPRDVSELQTVRKTLFELAKTPIGKYLPRAPSARSGHLFASIEESIALNGSKKTDEFCANNTDGLKLTTEIECEVGHAPGVAAHLLGPVVSSDSHKISLDATSSKVIAKDLSLAEYRLLWKVLCDPDIREGNIYVASTQTSSPTTKKDITGGVEPAHWRLSEGIRVDLRRIRKAITSARDLIGRQQVARLKSVFQSFESCLQRPEMATATKELLAIFHQFANMLKEPSLQKHLSKTQDRAAFVDDVNTFLLNMEAAINGRIEQRRVYHSAPFPNAYPAGASSILSAYTSMFYLSWEILNRSGKVTGDIHECDSEAFAGGVVAGRGEGVVCNELFINFREYVERQTAQSQDLKLARPLSILRSTRKGTKQWCSRICFFEVPDSLLMRTDDAFVQALHETGELSEWIERPENYEIRQRFNWWSINSLAFLVVETFESHLGVKAIDNYPQTLLFATRLVIVALSELTELRQVVNLAPASSRSDVYKAAREACDVASPRIFFQWLEGALFQIASQPRLVELTEAYFYEPPSEAPTNLFLIPTSIAEKIDEVTEKLDQRRQFSVELLPDLAMWTALQRITGLQMNGNLDDRLPHLHRAYAGMLRVAHAEVGEKTQGGFMTMLRWAFFVHTMIVQDSQEKGSPRDTPPRLAWVNELNKGLDLLSLSERGEFKVVQLNQLTRHIADMGDLFESPASLSNLLAPLKPFGGTADVWTASLDSTTLGTGERTLIEEFARTWNSGSQKADRVRLAFSFWAKAQRLRHSTMFTPKRK